MRYVGRGFAADLTGRAHDAPADPLVLVPHHSQRLRHSYVHNYAEVGGLVA